MASEPEGALIKVEMHITEASKSLTTRTRNVL
jgi:hypothetical protein